MLQEALALSEQGKKVTVIGANGPHVQLLFARCQQLKPLNCVAFLHAQAFQYTPFDWAEITFPGSDRENEIVFLDHFTIEMQPLRTWKMQEMLHRWDDPALD